MEGPATDDGRYEPKGHRAAGADDGMYELEGMDEGPALDDALTLAMTARGMTNGWSLQGDALPLPRILSLEWDQC